MKNILLVLFVGCLPVLAREALPPLAEGKAPQTVEDLWVGFDPRAEPLDVEILKEWEEDGVVLKVLRYRIGTFKGQKAMMAAVYGYPKGGTKLPGLVQIHGGGQYADYKAPLTSAKRGYATISISWAGRISAPDYRVTPNEVKLFWAGATNDPAYKVTTDWGPLDGYHAPCRNPKNAFAHVSPAEWTLDTVDSPRNNPWFLGALGARRALTFLEHQPEVDADKLGVYGHSMGGKLTVLTAGSDSRVKAAAPSCGGVSDRDSGKSLYDATISDDVYLKRISCPIVFLSPANDFHGRIDDLQTAVTEIQSTDWRVTCAPHHSHQDTPEYEAATLLWFDQQLKGSFTWPETPGITVTLETTNGVPSVSVEPDASKPILGVDVFYSQHGQVDGLKDNTKNTTSRFWYHAAAKNQEGRWTANLPVFSTDKPLWVYANVTYALKKPVTSAGYYYAVHTTEKFNLSSLMFAATAGELQAASVQPTLKPSQMIEPFEGDWEKEWFTYRPQDWARKTHKVYAGPWAAPVGAGMGMDVRSAAPNKIVIGIDGHAAEVELAGGSEWQPIELLLEDFRDAAGDGPSDWNGIKELRLGPTETLKTKVDGKETTLKLGGAWQGAKPAFRNLRWIEGR